MPHLLIERHRAAIFWPEDQPDGGKEGLERQRQREYKWTLAVEIAEILSGIIFTVGSICFFPSMSEDIAIFKFGCGCFIVGSIVYALISMYTLAEAVGFTGFISLEVLENMLYLLGSVAFLVGTVLYWPTGLPDAGDSMEFITADSQGRHMYGISVYVNTFSEAFEGSILSIIGCLFFALAAFVNALNKRYLHSRSSQLLTAATSFYMLGGLLFVMGGIAFMPDYGCSDSMVAMGAWAYTIGSIFYTIGSCVSLYRSATLEDNIEECGSLLGESLPVHYGVRQRRNSLPAKIF